MTQEKIDMMETLEDVRDELLGVMKKLDILTGSYPEYKGLLKEVTDRIFDAGMGADAIRLLMIKEKISKGN